MILPPPISPLFPYTTLFRSLERFENVLLLRTFSKSYGLAGLRIGFALGPPEVIEALDSVKDSYNVDRLAIAADRKSTRLNSSHRCISYAVFCLKKKKIIERD